MNRFLVRGRFIDPGALLESDRSLEISRLRILPSQQMLAELESSGQIVAGGVTAGCREIVFLVDVESNEELSAFMLKLPFWSLLSWKVTPLQTFSSRAALSTAAFK